MEPTHLVPRPRGSSWRCAIGRVLRQARLDQGLRLTDVCERAGLSPQYLSEIERGRKEASSQVLAAVTAALGITLVDLAGAVAAQLETTTRLRSATARPVPVAPPARSDRPAVLSTGLSTGLSAVLLAA